MALFRKAKPLSFHDATLVAISNCTRSKERDHCIVGDELAYICGLHMPAAVQAGIVDEVIA
jgi:hypothetical protein